MDLDNCFETYWRIRKKFASQSKKFYWGDHLDGRYFLTFILKENIHNKKILDIGVGTGIVLSELSKSNLKIGIDIDDVAISYGKKLDESIVYLKADTLFPPLKKKSLDIIFLNSMFPLFSIDDQKKIVYNAYDLLKYNGLLYVTTVNRDSISYRNLENALNCKEVHDLLNKYFRVVDIQLFNIIPNFPFGFPNIFYNLLLSNKLFFKLFLKYMMKMTTYRKAKWIIASGIK